MFTPKTNEARKAWVSYRIDHDRFGNDNTGKGAGVLEEEFDRWLAAEKADAWDEGFDNGYDQVLVEKSAEPGAGDLRVNPYRSAPEPTYSIPGFGPNPAATLTIRKEQ